MLDENFWNQRYLDGITGWDLGEVSPPIKAFFDQYPNKEAKILIPGCGNGHEAEYLYSIGFKNVHVLDLADEPLKNLKKRVPDFPEQHLHKGDFFEQKGKYDLIVEQTLFCAVDPSLRRKYAEKVKELLKEDGQLVGVLFNKDFEGGPPFGGSAEEYHTYFDPLFKNVNIDPCYNSVAPRAGSEVFIRIGGK